MAGSGATRHMGRTNLIRMTGERATVIETNIHNYTATISHNRGEPSVGETLAVFNQDGVPDVEVARPGAAVVDVLHSRLTGLHGGAQTRAQRL